MCHLILVLLVNLCFISSAVENSGTQNYIENWPEVGNIPVTAALNSIDATPAHFSPLKFFVSESCILQIMNIGVAVVSRPIDCEAVFLTGGPAHHGAYKLCSAVQFSAGVSRNSRVSTTEDGRGFPMQIQLWFRKTSSKAECGSDPANMIIIPFNIVVQGVYGTLMSKVYMRVVGFTSRINNTDHYRANVLNWLLDTLYDNYYVHNGTFIDVFTGKERFGALFISPGFSRHAYISYKQFNSLRRSFNENNQRRANQLGLYSLEGRPFLQANGVLKRPMA